MPQSKGKLKAQMMWEAEELIDKLLEQKKPASEITLSEIEQAAVEAGMSFQQAVAEHLVADSQQERAARNNGAERKGGHWYDTDRSLGGRTRHELRGTGRKNPTPAN